MCVIIHLYSMHTYLHTYTHMYSYMIQEYQEAATTRMAGGHPGLLIDGFPATLSETEVIEALCCFAERPTAHSFSGNGSAGPSSLPPPFPPLLDSAATAY